ncbi:MAG TPA: LytTR family DNA-binding domain-containing protein [Chitinophagaceae bacterium]|jgi:DNA-binding LytR/AlgR family response regulator|nr:LytTR family DNA-binding domain-containing protein [Chitinophagaceae bacterium]
MKAVIIEDENLIAQELQCLIKNVSGDVDIVEILPSLKTARKWFMSNAEPDLIFMDIQLSDGVSFELFDAYQLSCPIVFTTAYDEYAIRAFKVNGVDYLLKPIDGEELKKAIDKCRDIVESKTQFPTDIKQLVKRLSQPQATQSLYKEKFIVNFRHQWIPVNTSDIACFMKDNIHYIFTFSGEKHILDFTTMEEIEELLDPQRFYRANRQFIVNIDAIKSVMPHENQKLTLSLKAPLKMDVDVSREKAPAFKKWFDR